MATQITADSIKLPRDSKWLLAALHAAFDAESMSFDDFEQAKAILLERLQVR